MSGLLRNFRRLGLGFGLIAAAAVILLASDLRSRQGAEEPADGRSGRVRRVALVQHASSRALGEGARGIVEALAARGYTDGGTIALTRFNAEGDIATANAIAREITNGDFDLILTVSTPSLQTVAAANRSRPGRKTPHVFGVVTDPYAAGVGIDPIDHRQHPPYLTGYGSMQPVELLMKTLRTMRPELKRVGLVWNPAEANSFAQTKLAREVCRTMGLELVEGAAENAAAVQEGANSVVARGAEVLWISGDITVSLASVAVIQAAAKGRIPVVTSTPPNVLRGALMDLGCDYRSLGRQVGELAADVLEGTNPASVPVEDQADPVILLNETVLATLKDHWTIPPALRDIAAGWITATDRRLPANFRDTR